MIRRLHEKEQAHRAAHLAWFDLPGVREDLLQKQKDAKEAREMSLKIANFGNSDVPFLTCSLRVDWLSIPVQTPLERLPNLKLGVLTGVYSVKGALPWGDTSCLPLHEIRAQINAPGMWGTITPDSELLGHHLAATAPTPLTEAELDEKFFSDRHLRHGEDSKKFCWGKKSNVLGSYGKRKSSNSRRGDDKALHPFSSLKWKCWGRSSMGSNRVRVASK